MSGHWGAVDRGWRNVNDSLEVNRKNDVGQLIRHALELLDEQPLVARRELEEALRRLGQAA